MRVLITRPRHQAGEFAEELKSIGATPVFFPTISIEPVEDTSALDRALICLERYDWLVLTSANAADIVLQRMDNLGIQSFPKSLQVSAIGPKTAEKLLAYSIHPDFIPDKYIAEEVVPGLGDLRDRWVLLPMADIAHDTIPQAIRDSDGIAHVITAYHTVPSQPETEGLQAVKNGIDVITFTSGSTARNFINLIELSGMDPLNLPADPLIACIGPKTAKTATELGFNVSIVPEEYTITGLVEAMGDYFRNF